MVITTQVGITNTEKPGRTEEGIGKINLPELNFSRSYVFHLGNEYIDKCVFTWWVYELNNHT